MERSAPKESQHVLPESCRCRGRFQRRVASFTLSKSGCFAAVNTAAGQQRLLAGGGGIGSRIARRTLHVGQERRRGRSFRRHDRQRPCQKRKGDEGEHECGFGNECEAPAERGPQKAAVEIPCSARARLMRNAIAPRIEHRSAVAHVIHDGQGKRGGHKLGTQSPSKG